MSGEVEINKCNFCHTEKQVSRFYLRPNDNSKDPAFIYYCCDCGFPSVSEDDLITLTKNRFGEDFDMKVKLMIENMNLKKIIWEDINTFQKWSEKMKDLQKAYDLLKSRCGIQ